MSTAAKKQRKSRVDEKKLATKGGFKKPKSNEKPLERESNA